MRTAATLLLVGAGVSAAGVPHPHAASAGASHDMTAMKIHIRLEGRSLTATLDDSEAARDFLSLLPLTLTLTDYNSTEKVADLPRKLSTKGALAGVDPDMGDIAYFAPWGNLAIFYRDEVAHHGRNAEPTGGRLRMTRPHAVCHMVASLDGRIVVDGWPDAISSTVRRQYEEVHASYGGGRAALRSCDDGAPSRSGCAPMRRSRASTTGRRARTSLHRGTTRPSRSRSIPAAGSRGSRTRSPETTSSPSCPSASRTTTSRSFVDEASRTCSPARATWTCPSRSRRSRRGSE
jgi:hypothetical protein